MLDLWLWNQALFCWLTLKWPTGGVRSQPYGPATVSTRNARSLLDWDFSHWTASMESAATNVAEKKLAVQLLHCRRSKLPRWQPPPLVYSATHRFQFPAKLGLRQMWIAAVELGAITRAFRWKFPENDQLKESPNLCDAKVRRVRPPAARVVESMGCIRPRAMPRSALLLKPFSNLRRMCDNATKGNGVKMAGLPRLLPKQLNLERVSHRWQGIRGSSRHDTEILCRQGADWQCVSTSSKM
jgi:hypothetical protein